MKKEQEIDNENQKTQITSDINSNSEITESDYYNFLNDVLEEKNLIRNNKVKFPDLKTDSEYWRENLIFLTKNIEYKFVKKSKILTIADIDFIFEQYSEHKIFELDYNKLKINSVSKTVFNEVLAFLESDDLHKKPKHDYYGIYNINLPLFSINKKYAFFDHSHYCGLECAHNGIFVYELINGKWTEIGTIGILEIS